MKRLLLVCLFVSCLGSLAAAPPYRVAYQGVLRNDQDAPLDGTYDMVFRFFSSGAGGDEILVDTHDAGGGSAVVVAGGRAQHAHARAQRLGADPPDEFPPAWTPTSPTAANEKAEPAIRAGDLLVSSPTAGHAMRATDVVAGTVLGKALDGLEVGTGTIRVLLMSR